MFPRSRAVRPVAVAGLIRKINSPAKDEKALSSISFNRCRSDAGLEPTGNARQIQARGLDFGQMFRISPAKILRIPMALILVVWMSGTGCLLGCERGRANAQEQGNIASHNLTVVAGEACATAHSHNCCSRHSVAKQEKPLPPNVNDDTAKARAQLETSGAETSGSPGDCPLSVNALAVVTKVRHETMGPVTASVFELFPLQDRSLQPSHTFTFHLPNRGHTYLHCCVFLI